MGWLDGAGGQIDPNDPPSRHRCLPSRPKPIATGQAPSLFASAKGDASSEARRNGFIHHQQPQTTTHSHPSCQSFNPAHPGSDNNALDSRYICSNITTKRRDDVRRNGAQKTKNRRVETGVRKPFLDAA